MMKVREKPQVLEALRFSPETLPMAAYEAFLGDYSERLMRECPRGGWLLRGPDGACWAMSHEAFLDRYVEVAVGEEAAPPAELTTDQARDLADAALDAMMDHPDFARWWAESAAGDRRDTRRRLRDSLKEASS